MPPQPFLTITSSQNPRIKLAVKLRDRRDRDQEGLFLIEGYRELLRGAEAGLAIKMLFICPVLFLGANEQTLIQRVAEAGAEILECTPEVFRKISYRDRPDGLLAIAPQMHTNLAQLEERLAHQPNPLLVVAEAIEKPGNLGTILRSCDAVGADALIVCDRCTDIHNPNVVRASVGTLFTVPIVEAQGEEVLRWLRSKQIQILAATPSAMHLYTQVEMKGALAIAVGTEQLGLSHTWMSEADLQVRLPMCGVADSLNVATATTVLLYEALRQRST